MSDRDEYSVSNRSLLANASEEDMQSIEEAKALLEYKRILVQIREDQVKLQETNSILRQVYSAKNSSYTSITQELEEAASKIVERIDKNDRALITLETTTILKNVLEREKATLRKKLSQEAKEALNEYREKAKRDAEELSRKYQQSREETLKKRNQGEQTRTNLPPMSVSRESVQKAIQKQEAGLRKQFSEKKKERPKKDESSKTRNHSVHKAEKKENQPLFKLFLMSQSLTISLIMLNAPMWIISISTLLIFTPLLFGSYTYAAIVYCTYDIVRPVLYIWALVVTIQGKQDFFAIAFYVLVFLQIFSIVKRFIGTIGIILIALTDRKN